jgi:hypothetical protein
VTVAADWPAARAGGVTVAADAPPVTVVDTATKVSAATAATRDMTERTVGLGLGDRVRALTATIVAVRRCQIKSRRAVRGTEPAPGRGLVDWASGELRSGGDSEVVLVDVAGVVIAGLSLLLALAGYAKARRPEPSVAALRGAGIPAPLAVVRAASIAELAVAGAGLSLPGRWGGCLVAAAFACLALGAAVAGRGPRERACGCFGDADGAPFGPRHVITSLLCAGLAVGAALVAPDGLLELVSRRPGVAVAEVMLALTLALAVAEWLRGRGAGRLEASALRLVDSSALALEARFSRRCALMRIAVAGSALSVAPLRYLLYPGTALAVVVPGSCGEGLCTDGYTAFCCEITQGVNGCPAGTFPGGWWMCTDYRGHQLCEGAGVRYYVDCNALPGRPFPGGCRCAGGSCDKRRQACNVFRYGQCNTQVEGTTAVVCRVVTCQNPGTIEHYNCSPAVMIDDAVCGHEAGCLEPMAQQLAGVGGA